MEIRIVYLKSYTDDKGRTYCTRIIKCTFAYFQPFNFNSKNKGQKLSYFEIPHLVDTILNYETQYKKNGGGGNGK